MNPQHSDVMRDVVRSLCESIDSPRSLAVWLCFDSQSHEALLELPMPAVATCDTREFQKDYFITEYLSKYKGLKTSWDLRAVALGKWRFSEVQCRETNARVREHMLRPLNAGRVEALLSSASRKIACVLGPLKLTHVLASCKWGPGATFDIRRSRATPDQKISNLISVTATALSYLRAVVESDPHWLAVFLGQLPSGPVSLLRNPYKLVRGSRFLTVPKSAKTDRCIAAEPTGNGFLQQGVHNYMRRRLKRFGIDLDDQSINKRLAQDAFKRGLATLDLSAASDTISTELVFALLPIDWALFLNDIRSRETLVDGAWVRTEKFASMGNAFCFELETLIFWALASAACEKQGYTDGPLSVYGDDIIVPGRAADEVVSILKWCGFTVNEKKSFLKGNFFESCGGHYHRGQDVTPVYQKELVIDPPELIRAHNRIVRLSKRLEGFNPVGALRALRNAYPWRPFPRIPFGVPEDGGFLCDVSEFSLDRNHGYRCHVLDYVTAVKPARDDALLAYKLRRFSFQNARSNGHAGRVHGGRWRTKVRWLSEALVAEGSSPDDPT